MKYPVLIQTDEESTGFIVSCPSLPGCVSQGETKQEALENIAEAIQAWIESSKLAGDPIPAPGEVLDVEVTIPDAA